jgi:hypothetical protein
VVNRGIATATVGPGDTALLWTDVWNGHCLTNDLPRLFTFARNKQITLAQYIHNPDVFHTPLSQQAANELWQLNQLIEQAQQNQQEKDVWGYIWGCESNL